MRRRRITDPTVTRIRDLTDLTPDVRNANRGTARGRQLLGASLRAYGAGRSILVDRAGRVIAGNKTLAEARAHGIPVDALEAVSFAVLGWCASRGEPCNLPAATGAGQRVVLGARTPP